MPLVPGQQRPTGLRGKPCAHLSSSAPGLDLDRASKDRSIQLGPGPSGGVGPPPHPHSRLPPATLPLACAHLLTVGHRTLGDPLGQAPRVQPSRWPQPWQEGHLSREALPRCPPPPTSRHRGGGGVGKERSCLKTSPRTFSPTKIPAPGNGTWGSTTNLSSVRVQTSPSPTPCCIRTWRDTYWLISGGWITAFYSICHCVYFLFFNHSCK